MTSPLYDFIPIAPFARFTSGYINSELGKIQSAIDLAAKNGTIQNGSFTFSGTLNTVVLDVSSITAADYYTVTLPASPSVGDAPCTLTLYAASRSAMTDGTVTHPVIIRGSGADPINGTTLHGCYLLAIGESVTLRWVGGELGWVFVNANLGIHAASGLHSQITTLMPFRSYIFSGAGAMSAIPVVPRFPGAFFRIALNTDTSLTLGGATDNFKSIYGSTGGVDHSGALAVPADGNMYTFACRDGTASVGHWMVTK